MISTFDDSSRIPKFSKFCENIPPIVIKGLLKGTQVCKRDFSKGFQVRESKGGNKVRFLIITQKGGIQGGNPRGVFLVRAFLGRIKI